MNSDETTDKPGAPLLSETVFMDVSGLEPGGPGSLWPRSARPRHPTAGIPGGVTVHGGVRNGLFECVVKAQASISRIAIHCPEWRDADGPDARNPHGVLALRVR